MSVENAKKFVRFMVNECGEFDQDDFVQAMKELKAGAETELSAEEIDSVAGGGQEDALKGLRMDGLRMDKSGLPVMNSGVLKKNKDS